MVSASFWALDLFYQFSIGLNKMSHRHLNLTSETELIHPEKPVSSLLQLWRSTHFNFTRNFGVIQPLTHTVTTFKLFNKIQGSEWMTPFSSYLLYPYPTDHFNLIIMFRMYFSFPPHLLPHSVPAFVPSHIGYCSGFTTWLTAAIISFFPVYNSCYCHS